MKNAFFLLLLFAEGCFPDMLAPAAKEFARENYPATVRELNRYLTCSQNLREVYTAHEDIRRAAAYFYFGLAKRACLIEQAAGVPLDFCESGRFRYRKPQRVPFTAEEILNDYRRSEEVAPELVCGIDFHVGMELLFAGKFCMARERFDRFVKRVSVADRSLLVKQFESEDVLEECITFANDFVSASSLQDGLAICETFKTKGLTLYRGIFFRKSAGHELHNMNLLMRKYAVRRFGFLRRDFDVEAEYDYLAKTMECGMDFLILRGRLVKDRSHVFSCFQREGFCRWKALESSEELILVGRMGIKVFEGSRDIPISICAKKADFDYVLVAVFSEEKHVLYCMVQNEEDWKLLHKAVLKSEGRDITRHQDVGNFIGFKHDRPSLLRLPQPEPRGGAVLRAAASVLWVAAGGRGLAYRRNPTLKEKDC